MYYVQRVELKLFFGEIMLYKNYLIFLFFKLLLLLLLFYFACFMSFHVFVGMLRYSAFSFLHLNFASKKKKAERYHQCKECSSDVKG